MQLHSHEWALLALPLLKNEVPNVETASSQVKEEQVKIKQGVGFRVCGLGYQTKDGIGGSLQSEFLHADKAKSSSHRLMITSPLVVFVSVVSALQGLGIRGLDLQRHLSGASR